MRARERERERESEGGQIPTKVGPPTAETQESQKGNIFPYSLSHHQFLCISEGIAKQGA